MNDRERPETAVVWFKRRLFLARQPRDADDLQAEQALILLHRALDAEMGRPAAALTGIRGRGQGIGRSSKRS